MSLLVSFSMINHVWRSSNDHSFVSENKRLVSENHLLVNARNKVDEDHEFTKLRVKEQEEEAQLLRDRFDNVNYKFARANFELYLVTQELKKLKEECRASR
ncbi:hypothetical protein L6452_38926 [Arctium lappa]|uniref:Uncharacterized protein n=1 Tax=Arctium lappa TaxID=4217 RepID=A0ACB8XRM7_ARCLA|nr:hypothetical protein L6452_38926 [Arctium lappa]